MESKYTRENVDKALARWEYARDLEPRLNSIKSRMHISEENTDLRPIRTSFVFTKKVSLLPLLGIMGHYFVSIDDRVWHPGHNWTDTIFEDYDIENSQTVCVEEMCHFCLYRTMDNMFFKDRQFNIMFNNCQIVTGYIWETVLSIFYLLLLVMAIITGHVIFLIITFLIVIVLIVYNLIISTSSIITFAWCPHINYKLVGKNTHAH